MNKNFLEIVNKDMGEATLRLYGGIGDEIDGNLFAQTLAQLDDEVDTINIRINSGGGSVLPGLSIVSAMLAMRARVNVYVDGVAASMAAVIAICGDYVYMADYAKIMVHDPFVDNGGAKLSEKDKKGLDRITECLRTILSRRGKKEVDMANLMAAETWFSADEAKAAGLIDEVVSSKRKATLSKLSAKELEKIIRAEHDAIHGISNQLNNNNMDFKAIAKKMGLPEAATEAEILAAIDAQNVATAAAQGRLIDSYITAGKAHGTVTEKNEARLRKLAVADFELFVETVEAEMETAAQGAAQASPAAGASRLSQAIANAAKATAATATGTQKTWDHYQKHDPEGLAALEKSNPALFNQLLEEYENGL